MRRKELKNQIHKLELHPGDVLVIRDYDTLMMLQQMPKIKELDFPIPILFAPNGIDAMPLEQLKAFVAQAEIQMGLTGSSPIIRPQ